MDFLPPGVKNQIKGSELLEAFSGSLYRPWQLRVHRSEWLEQAASIQRSYWHDKPLIFSDPKNSHKEFMAVQTMNNYLCQGDSATSKKRSLQTHTEKPDLPYLRDSGFIIYDKSNILRAEWLSFFPPQLETRCHTIKVQAKVYKYRAASYLPQAVKRISATSGDWVQISLTDYQGGTMALKSRNKHRQWLW